MGTSQVFHYFHVSQFLIPTTTKNWHLINIQGVFFCGLWTELDSFQLEKVNLKMNL